MAADTFATTIPQWIAAAVVFTLFFRGSVIAIRWFNAMAEVRHDIPLCRVLLKQTSRVLPAACSLYIASLLLPLSTFGINLVLALCMSALLYQIFKWLGGVFDYYDTPERVTAQSFCHPRDNRWICRR